MDTKKFLGIVFILLGLLFIVYPVYSSAVVSFVVGLCLFMFGFAEFIDGFSALSIATHLSAVKIIIGILAMLFGFLFIYKIDALSFIFGMQFYIIAFIMLLAGVIGLVSDSTMSKLGSAIIFIMGIIAFVLAYFSFTGPLYAAILLGVCLIVDGVCFVVESSRM